MYIAAWVTLKMHIQSVEKAISKEYVFFDSIHKS